MCGAGSKNQRKKYLERQVKEVNSKLPRNLGHRIKHNRAFRQILKQQNHVRQDLHAIELERGVHVRGLTRPHISAVGSDVAELLPPVADRDEQRIVIQRVQILVLNPEREVYGCINRDFGAGVEMEALDAEADNGEVGVGRPEKISGGDEEKEDDGEAEYTTAPCLTEEAVGRRIGGKNDDVLRWLRLRG